MFTGLVQSIGEVREIKRGDSSAILKIFSPKIVKKLEIGGSISVNGVCLTATKLKSKSFEADVMVQTLKLTNLGELLVGSEVNLELPARGDSFLGGHIVQGHVDGVGKVSLIEDGEKWRKFEVKVPKELLKYINNQGSITIDGTSLTVGSVQDSIQTVTLWLIPETLAKTTLGSKSIGDSVNVEVDVIAKYVERILEKREGGK
jgi:riboflavin synthase